LPPRTVWGSSSFGRRVEVESREGGVLVVEIFLNVARYLVIFKRRLVKSKEPNIRHPSINGTVRE